MEFAGFQDFIDKLDGFQEGLYRSISAFPEHFNASEVEWAKTMAQLNLWLALGKFDGFDRKEGGITMQILSSARVWRRCANLMADLHIAMQNCAYPRCFQRSTREGTLRVRYLCQKCNTVTYCDTNCQRAVAAPRARRAFKNESLDGIFACDCGGGNRHSYLK
ncbi:hypothetical protein FRC12_014889 [Ceratobasidium sp. 428]|nr:hypothetical protein FRC12_014889 [Ceratobasidium sp. 428]